MGGRDATSPCPAVWKYARIYAKHGSWRKILVECGVVISAFVRSAGRGNFMDQQPVPAEYALPGEAPSRPAQAAMRAAMQAYADRINAGDLDGILALFAPDAVIEDPVGTAPKCGPDALRAWFGDTVAFGTRIDPVAPIRGSHANAAALMFDVTFRPAGGPAMRIRSLDVCAFDADARISSLKAYWGPEDMEALPD
jgi:steroid delta-isomerase